MTQKIPSNKEELFLRRVGAVNQVTVWPAEKLSVMGSQTAPAPVELGLPAQFRTGAGWQLSHPSLRTGEVVTWNWAYKDWFSGGDGLSTYYFRDETLLDAIAQVFSRLVPVREGNGPALDYEYHVAGNRDGATAQSLPSGGLPGLLFYASPSGAEQFLALYNLHKGNEAEGTFSSVHIHEIVQVEVADKEAFRMRLFKAHQAAVHYRREFWS